MFDSKSVNCENELMQHCVKTKVLDATLRVEKVFIEWSTQLHLNRQQERLSFLMATLQFFFNNELISHINLCSTIMAQWICFPFWINIDLP